MEFLRTAERAALHVSVSQVRTFLGCAKRYEYRYVLGAKPEHRSPNLVLGSAVHEALAAYYLALKAEQQPEGADVLAAYSKAFDHATSGELPMLLDEDETLADIKASGVALVQAFLAGVQRPDRVLAVEEAFSADIIDPVTGEFLEEGLTGYFDAIVEIGNEIVILEHKTAARAWSQDQVDFDLQVSLYQAVIDADRVRLQVMTKTKVAKFLTYDVCRTQRQQVEAVTIVCRVLDAIRARAFWPNPGWACRDCEFRVRCRG